ncbi:hypothetical protein LB941_10665 [Ligilactobacillus sp. WILCCON 0076]|uniref:Uncharacterized protein n=1 Tax=Ligilactobacillus ubinensis TaxID=2876789 RepID=A0A9X2JPA7_9LACO|nr:hypothetical protein [Ligilactobacillus ubinensis]MCP0887791.1 hypothetical protein [Ligilactobacillus ubinensis]
MSRLHGMLGLGWDEWASITVIIGSVFGAFGFIGRNLLKKYEKEPMEGIRKDLKTVNDAQKENINALEKREAQQDKLLDQHDKMLLEHNLKITDLEEKVK